MMFSFAAGIPRGERVLLLDRHVQAEGGHRQEANRGRSFARMGQEAPQEPEISHLPKLWVGSIREHSLTL